MTTLRRPLVHLPLAFRHRRRRAGAWGLLALVLLGACSRFRTTDQLRDDLRGVTSDSTWMTFPCQGLVVDEFGWTLDSLENVGFRLPPALFRQGARTFWHRLYTTRNRRQRLELQFPRGMVNMIDYSRQLTQMRRAECSIADRAATVVVGRRGFDYETTVLWHDIGDGRQLLATASGRSMGEVQQLRAALFTMKFP